MTFVKQYRRITVRELASQVGVTIVPEHSRLTEDLGLQRMTTKFGPKPLTVEQKQPRLQIAQDMLDNANSDPNFPNNGITGDEPWVYGSGQETEE